MLEISSRTNTIYRKYLSLLESKGLKKEGVFLLSGKNLIKEFLKNPTLEIEAEIFAEDMKPQSTKSPHVKLSQTLFDEIDVLGTHSSILALKQPELPMWDFEKPHPGLQLLCPLGDPSNLGALVRSAEAFGIQNLILLNEAANPFLPKAVKASAGSLLRMKIWKGPSIKDITARNVVALDLKGTPLANFRWPSDAYLLVGEEGAGVPPIAGLQKISIPIQNVESLNATVASSIALYDFSQKLKK